MLIKKFEGNSPKIDPKAFVAETAVVIGKAELKEYSSVWYNVTIRGDVNEIKVGRYTNVQDNSVLHVSDSHACILGDYVTVGHCALLHACTVEDHVLIGMHSTVLDGAVIGKGSMQAYRQKLLKNCRKTPTQPTHRPLNTKTCGPAVTTNFPMAAAKNTMAKKLYN